MNSEPFDVSRIVRAGRTGKITRMAGSRVIYAKIDGGGVVAFTPAQTIVGNKAKGFRRYRGESLHDLGLTEGRKVRVQISEVGSHLKVDNVLLE
jgi:hypothetical protein